MHKQQIVVIGLGVFGETVATELTRLGHDVLGVDSDPHTVDRLAESITHVVIADVTNERALEELNVGQYDAAVVAIGQNIEATMLATMQLRALGVAKVWTKALTAQHRRILERLGATRIIGPEFEMGMQIAEELHYPMVNNYIGLGDDEFVVEVIVSEQLQGRTMRELISETEAKATVVAIKRQDKTSLEQIDDLKLREGDQVVLVGLLQELRKLASLT